MPKIIIHLFMVAIFGCRKDPKLATVNIPNPCGDTTKLYCIYPNTVADSVHIFIANPKHGNVVMTYFDRYGNDLGKVLDSALIEGNHLFVFGVDTLPIGLNVCIIEMDGESHLAKMIKV